MKGIFIMKKTFVVLSLFLSLVSITSSVAANGFWEGFLRGQAIRENIERQKERDRIMRGSQTQDIYVNKHYDFSRIHKMFLTVQVAKGFEKEISDEYILKTYVDDMEDAFKGKSVKLDSYHTIKNKLLSIYPNWANMTVQEKGTRFQQYVYQNYDAILTVKFFAYMQSQASDVAVKYTVKETRNNNDVFNDTDCRFDVFNKSKRDLLNNMTNKFVSEFFKVIDRAK